MPVGWPKLELARPLLDDRAALVGARAELVEEHVGGDLERARQRERAEDGVAGVLELAPAVAEHAGVVERRARRDDAGVHRRERGDRLERRARRIARGDRAVEQRRAVLLAVELARRSPGRSAWRRGSRRSSGRSRARAPRRCAGPSPRRARVGRVPLTCAASIARATAFWAARWSPRSSVSRSWRPWIGSRARGAARVVAVAERVDDHAREAVGPAQVGVVGLLDAVLADPRAGRRRRGSACAELVGRDLAQRAEELRAELLYG